MIRLNINGLADYVYELECRLEPELLLMKQIDRKTSALFKWLAEHEASLEELGETDRRLFVLIVEYGRLMDAIEYWRDDTKGEDEAFARLLKNKELEIIEIINSNTE